MLRSFLFALALHSLVATDPAACKKDIGDASLAIAHAGLLIKVRS
jgi:hypothetical protein